MWERLKSLSDLEADMLDILVSEWLKQAKTSNDRALIKVDDLIALRGIKPKQNGQGRRGGYTPEQRRTHLRAATVIFDLWLNMDGVVYYVGKRKRTRRLFLQSRPFVITDRLGELRLYDEYIDVQAFKYVPGEVFAVFLMGSHQTALLSARALKYNFSKQWWHKRLTRYYSYLWGCQAAGRDYERPLNISAIFRDGLRVEIDTRCLAQTKARFVNCHRILRRDGVIAGWRYEQQDGPWSEWTIVVEPPDKIRRSYEGGPPAVPSFELVPLIQSPSRTEECCERIRTKRESLGLPQRRLAKQLGISQAGIARAESGSGSIPEVLRNWVAAS
jgi:DNA-binding XRE family transcriptional regulator